eukprot:8495797-Pyramimonas_sp.AAC.1
MPSWISSPLNAPARPPGLAARSVRTDFNTSVSVDLFPLPTAGDVTGRSVGASAHPPGAVTENVHLIKDFITKIYKDRTAAIPGML